MCRAWDIHHKCGHAETVRLSTCRGSYTVETINRHGVLTDVRKPVCCGDAGLSFKSGHLCASCGRGQAEVDLEAELKKARARLAVRAHMASRANSSGSSNTVPGKSPAMQLKDLQTQFDQRRWTMMKSEWPDVNLKKTSKFYTRPQRERGSLLKHEILDEEIAVADEATNWEDWGDAFWADEKSVNQMMDDGDGSLLADETEEADEQDQDGWSETNDEDNDSVLYGSEHDETDGQNDTATVVCANAEQQHEQAVTNSSDTPSKGRALFLTASISSPIKIPSLGIGLPQFMELSVK